MTDAGTRARLRSVLRTLLPLGALALVCCWEQPVTDRMELDFRKADSIGIHVSEDVASSWEIDNPLVRERVDHKRADLTLGADAWDRRFGSINAEEERLAVDRKRGEISRMERYAAVDKLNLDKFLADTSISVIVAESGEWTDVTITAGESTRATPRQISEMRREMDRWCNQVSLYVAAVARLYSYLDANPGRAEACLWAVYGPLTEGQNVPPPVDAELTERETELARAVSDGITEIDKILKSYENKAYSLQELTSLVYDPFPAQFSLRVPARIVAVEGFRKKDAEVLEVPRPEPIEALEMLLGRWVSPDPISWFLGMDEDERLDFAAVVAEDRRVVSVPSSTEVRAAMEEKLRPPATYHVRWRNEE